MDPAILDAALELARAGSFTMDELSARLGISRATLYRRSGGRRAILDAVAPAGSAAPPDVRARILDAAGLLFAEQGMTGGTVEAIAKQAQVGSATVYRHFGDRAGLIAAFYEERGPRGVVEELRAQSSGDLAADLTQLATAAIAFLGTHRALVRLALSPEPEAVLFREAMQRRQQGGRQLLAEVFRRHMETGELVATDPLELASSFVGLLVTRAMLMPELGEVAPPEDRAGQAELAASLVRLFLDGARVRPVDGSHG